MFLVDEHTVSKVLQGGFWREFCRAAHRWWQPFGNAFKLPDL